MSHLTLVKKALESRFDSFDQVTLTAFDDFKILCEHGDPDSLKAREKLLVESEDMKYDCIDNLNLLLKPREIKRGYDCIGLRSSRRIVDAHHLLFKPLDDKARNAMKYHQEQAVLVGSEVAKVRIIREITSLGLDKLFHLMEKDKHRGDAQLVLAGGFVHACCLDQKMFEYITEKTNVGISRNPDEKSDLDFFVIGSDEEAKRNIFRKAMTIISCQKNVTISTYGSVLRFMGLAREVQLIFSSEKDLCGLLVEFDMSHIQCGFMNGEIYVTNMWQLFTPCNRTLIYSGLQSAYRLAKALRRGFAPVYDTRSFAIKGQSRISGNKLFQGDKFISFDKSFITLELKKDEKTDTTIPLPRWMNMVDVKGEDLGNSYCNEEKRKDIPWKEITLSEGVELSENIEAMKRGFAHYKSMSATLPISDRHDDSEDAGIWSLSLFSCKIGSFYTSYVNHSEKKYVRLEGALKVTAMKGIRDPTLMEMVKEEYLLREEKLCKSRTYWSEVWTRDSKTLFEKIAELETKDKLTTKEKGLLKTFKSRVRSLSETLHRVNSIQNEYALSELKYSTIARLHNRKMKISGENLFKKQIGPISNVVLPHSRNIAELVYNHPHDKVFKNKAYQGLTGKTVGINYFEAEINEYRDKVTLCDGFFIDLKRANTLGLKFNASFHFNGTDMLVPHREFEPKDVLYKPYYLAGSNFIDKATSYYRSQQVEFKNLEEFFTALSKDLVKNDKLRKILAETMDVERKRERDLPGAKMEYRLDELYAIKL